MLPLSSSHKSCLVPEPIRAEKPGETLLLSRRLRLAYGAAPRTRKTRHTLRVGSRANPQARRLAFKRTLAVRSIPLACVGSSELLRGASRRSMTNDKPLRFTVHPIAITDYATAICQRRANLNCQSSGASPFASHLVLLSKSDLCPLGQGEA